jgi:prefoldin subunit 4
MSDDVIVREIDQQNICNFSIYADELREIKKKLKELETEKELIADMDDEVLLSEDLRAGEGMLFRLGDVFIEMEDEQFNSAISKETQRISKEIEQLQEKLEQVQTLMTNLKAELYDRFRNQIALEYD